MSLNQVKWTEEDGFAIVPQCLPEQMVVLLNRMPRTAKHALPRTAATSCLHWFGARQISHDWNQQQVPLRVLGCAKV
jgi:hypothetical protein